MMYITALVIVCVFAIGIYATKPARSSLPKGVQLPSGPPGKPIVGNLLDISPHHSWLQFYEWSRQYGPLYRLNIAGRNNIIVSTEGIANDLLRERGTIYSSREQLPMAARLLSHNLRPLFYPYDETWRQSRKLMHALVNVNVAVAYWPVQEEESLRTVRDLVRFPTEYERWFERYSAGLILRLAYSKTIYTGEEAFVKTILKVVHTVERVASPGAYLVDTIPALLWLPSFMAPFKREASKLHAEELELFRNLLNEGVRSSPQGFGSENFCGKWHHNRKAYKISDDHVAYTIGTLFEAGAGTTAAAMMSFMLAMTLFPEEFAKLQNEVDAVVGPGRLPCFGDIPDLPRVRAVAKETLRWRPVTAGGLPHMLTKDDVYEVPGGKPMFLRAGSNVHPVQWSIHREPQRYPEPDSFRPERWLDRGWPTYKEPLTEFPNLHNYSAFGFGRRICPGQDIAGSSMYILIARIAWGCDIFQRVDSEGNAKPPPVYEYVTGFNVQPKPFHFDLKARRGRQDILDDQCRDIWGDDAESSQNP